MNIISRKAFPRLVSPPMSRLANRFAYRSAGYCRCGSQNQRNTSSKDQNSQIVHLELQACLWLIWSSDPGCVSYRTCGYRTREPPLYLAERRQGSLHGNAFRVSSPMLQCGLRKRRGALGVVLGTSQYIVMWSS
jgi:hypothetical protein